MIETRAPHARYALLDRSAAGWSVTLRAVAYDWDAAARRADDEAGPIGRTRCAPASSARSKASAREPLGRLGAGRCGTRAGWAGYGARGLALAVSVIAFWLLLQFNRVVRVMRAAAASPVGHVANAVMLHSKLQAGLPMVKVVALTKSLGLRVDPEGDVYRWVDDGGAAVTITFANGRCAHWALTRAAAD